MIESLRERIRQIERAPGSPDSSDLVPGMALDRLLHRWGVRRGMLVEWLAASSGAGAGSLALRAAWWACRGNDALVVVDSRGDFYPPAAALLGVDLSRLIVIHPTQSRDAIWAIDQSLRCGGVGGVYSCLDRLDTRAFRRLQVAADAGGGLGLLVRPIRAASEISHAAVRLRVDPVASAGGRCLRLELLRCRSGTNGEVVELEMDDETGDVHLVAGLAAAAAVRRSARA